MADIRINALATTAASTASDDFIAVDGSANGTRKLNAYSPTFGGNLTVSGTIYPSGASATLTASVANTIIGSNGATRLQIDHGNGGWGRLQIIPQQTRADISAVLNNATTAQTLGLVGSSVEILTSGGTLAATFNSSQNTTLAGNLTVSGTGNNIFNSGGGNFLIGTTTNRSNRVHIAAAGPSYIGMGQLTSTYAGIVFGDVTLADSASGFNIAGNAANSNLVFNVNTGGSMNWRVGNANAFTLSSASNLLLGTTTDVGPRLLSKAKDNTYAGAGIGIVDQSAGTSYITRANGTFYISNNGSTDHFALDASGNATFAGKVTPTSGIVGVTTNSNAAAGIVGEFVSSAVVSGSAVSLTNATAANITSISLTAGDWDVTGLVQYNFTGATCSYVYHGFSSASAAFGAPNSYVQDYRNYTTASVSTHNPSLTFRISLAATTTIYFVTQADFSAGTVAAYGRIQARRVR